MYMYMYMYTHMPMQTETCTHAHARTHAHTHTHITEAPQVVPRPLPHASRTNLYDDHWIAKQEKGMTVWVRVFVHMHERL